MKVFANNAVYVQLSDLAFLIRSDVFVPSSVADVFRDGTININYRNRYEFIKFSKIEDVEYFRNLDYIIDYNEFNEFNEDFLKTFASSLADQYNKFLYTYNSMSEEEKEENQDLHNKCDELDYKCNSIEDLIAFKQGKIKFKLPHGVENSNYSIKELLMEKIGRRK